MMDATGCWCRVRPGFCASVLITVLSAGGRCPGPCPLHIGWNGGKRHDQNAETSDPDQAPTPVFAGVDTHKELHVAAVIDAGETVLGTKSFPTTRTGYRSMLAWIGDFGDLARIGVEGAGSYGARLTRHLAKPGVMILEVDRPDRSDRLRKGKDDDLDAINAARAALHGRRTSIPKSKDGAVEALRVLRITRARGPGAPQRPATPSDVDRLRAEVLRNQVRQQKPGQSPPLAEES